MNHFTLLQLPASYTLSEQTLEAAYFAAQRHYHPDRFVNKSPEERLAAAQKSADINTAYNTLKHPLSRAKHLLTLAGVGVAHDHSTEDTAMLADIMDLQEQIAEGKAPNIAALRAQTEAILADAFAHGDLATARMLTSRLGYLARCGA